MNDLRLAIRFLGKTPGFSAIVVATVALGIGSCTALFSVMNTLLFQSLPVADIDRLAFGIPRLNGDPFLVTFAEYDAWCSARSFEKIGAAWERSLNLVGQGDPERIASAEAEARYFATLGARPQFGRTYSEAEDRNNASLAVVGHGFALRHYGTASLAVGQTLELEGRVYTVIGVMPPGFDLPIGTEVWIPLGHRINDPATRYSRGLFVVARLERGVTLTAANQEIAGISDRLAAEVPSQYSGWVTQFIPLRHQTMEDLDSRLPTKLLLLIGGSGFLLLIACSNVANLLLARSLVRTRDRAIRAALGATPGRLLWQTCTENLVLALLGGILGIILALWLTPWMLRLSPIQPIAFAEHLQSPVVDWPVLGFAVGASLITALLISLPALRRSTNLDLRAIIQSGGSTTGSTSGIRWREGLVISQLALALTLLAGAALLVKSFTRLQATPLGFEPGGILAARVALPEQRYASHSDRRRFVDAVLSKLRTMPGVRSAGTTTTLPLHLDGWNAGFIPERGPLVGNSQANMSVHQVVSPGYLESMRFKPLKGRLITEHDRSDSARVVVVSESFARVVWPDQEPLGQRVRRARGRPDEWMAVIGVVADAKEDRRRFRYDSPSWYIPYAQLDTSQPIHFVVRTDGEPLNTANALLESVRSVDSKMPVFEIIRLSDHVQSYLGPERFPAVLLGVFSGLGVFLAALGIYGMISYMVNQRTRELGIRIALGADSRAISYLVLERGARLLLPGLALGIAGAWALTRLLGGYLYETSAYDPIAYGAALTLLTLVGLFACMLPARRATRIDPVVALKHE